MSRAIWRKDGVNHGSIFDTPPYIYDSVNDEFTDTATGNKFSKNSLNVKLEDNKAVSITDNGEIVIEPTEGKDAMKKVTATVAVAQSPELISLDATANTTYTAPTGKGYGTVVVNVPIESNKADTIDVSQYVAPVEITPTSGNAGMAKTTVTLTNIPAPTNIGYTWKMSPTGETGKDMYVILPFGVSPDTLVSHDANDKYYSAMAVGSGGNRVYTIRYKTLIPEASTPDESYTNILYTKTSDTVFTLVYDYVYDDSGTPVTEHYDYTFEYVRPIFSDNPWA